MSQLLGEHLELVLHVIKAADPPSALSWSGAAFPHPLFGDQVSVGSDVSHHALGQTVDGVGVGSSVGPSPWKRFYGLQGPHVTAVHFSQLGIICLWAVASFSPASFLCAGVCSGRGLLLCCSEDEDPHFRTWTIVSLSACVWIPEVVLRGVSLAAASGRADASFGSGESWTGVFCSRGNSSPNCWKLSVRTGSDDGTVRWFFFFFFFRWKTVLVIFGKTMWWLLITDTLTLFRLVKRADEDTGEGQGGGPAVR